MSLSEVVSSQGRFIAGTGRCGAAINKSGGAPARHGTARLSSAPPAEQTLSEALSHAAAQPQARRPAPGKARPAGGNGEGGPPTAEARSGAEERAAAPRGGLTTLGTRQAGRGAGQMPPTRGLGGTRGSEAALWLVLRGEEAGSGSQPSHAAGGGVGGPAPLSHPAFVGGSCSP